MIKNFRCPETEKLFRGFFSESLPDPVQRTAMRKLALLHAAAGLDFLRFNPSHRLEPISRETPDRWSIDIDDERRLAFRWTETPDNRGDESVKRNMTPVHPGEVLMEDFLKPMNITQYRLAKSIGVSQRRIGEIIVGKRAVTADTALRLSRFFGTDAQSWMNLQAHYDLEVEAERMDEELQRIVTASQLPKE